MAANMRSGAEADAEAELVAAAMQPSTHAGRRADSIKGGVPAKAGLLLSP